MMALVALQRRLCSTHDWFYKQLLSRDFKFSTDPGSWTTLLGFGVKRDRARRSVTLSARKYIETMYLDHMADDAKACNVPTPALPAAASLITGRRE